MSRRWAAVLLLLLTSCGGVDAPRWSDAAAADAARSFDSPRRQFVVVANPDIGNVTLTGTVRGSSSIGQDAPSDGRVLEVFFARGDLVDAGDDVLVFLPAPTEAELIALDIAQLDIDYAVSSEAEADEIARLETVRDDLEASYEDRTTTFSAAQAGVIGGTRQNIEYSVRQGDLLFELQDPSEPRVVATIDASEADTVVLGTSVTLAAPTAAEEILTGQVTDLVEGSRLAPDGQVAVIVELDTPAEVELGDRLTVSLSVEAGDGAQWVPLAAVGRRDGSRFVLVVDDQDRLRRLEVVLGRRTLSHVQVLGGIDVGMVLAVPQ